MVSFSLFSFASNDFVFIPLMKGARSPRAILLLSRQVLVYAYSVCVYIDELLYNKLAHWSS